MKTKDAFLVLLTAVYVSNWWAYAFWKHHACFIVGILGGIAILAGLLALTLSEMDN